ncbi:MAG: DUF1622 domain-containing protein [Bacteriovoracia bacterium]
MLEQFFHWTALVIEAVGVIIIVLGAIHAIYLSYKNRKHNSEEIFESFRRQLGRSILLGLEFLVAADIIATVSTKPDMDQVLGLALIVLIRTFLSFSLEIELEGKFPWRRK